MTGAFVVDVKGARQRVPLGRVRDGAVDCTQARTRLEAKFTDESRHVVFVVLIRREFSVPHWTVVRNSDLNGFQWSDLPSQTCVSPTVVSFEKDPPYGLLLQYGTSPPSSCTTLGSSLSYISRAGKSVLSHGPFSSFRSSSHPHLSASM